MNRFAATIAICVLAFLFTGCSSATTLHSSAASSSTGASIAASTMSLSSSATSDRVSAAADTVFGFPEQVKTSSGSGSNIGTVGVFYAHSSECTDENLEKWFNQYVRWGLDNWCVIMYTDQPGFGVYANSTYAEANVPIGSDYMLGDDSDAVFYVFSSDDALLDGVLVRHE